MSEKPTFTLEQLRPGLDAIERELSSAAWAHTDDVLYGSIHSASKSGAKENSISRIKAAFPAEVWETLDLEERRAKAAKLRAEADALDGAS